MESFSALRARFRSLVMLTPTTKDPGRGVWGRGQSAPQRGIFKGAGAPLNGLFPSFLPEVIFQHNLEKRPSEVALRKKPASGTRWVAISRGSSDNAPARWFSTLSMGALLVLPQRYSVYQVRSGRKQPRQMTRVPGCSWQGPHPFLPPTVSSKNPNMAKL